MLQSVSCHSARLVCSSDNRYLVFPFQLYKYLVFHFKIAFSHLASIVMWDFKTIRAYKFTFFHTVPRKNEHISCQWQSKVLCCMEEKNNLS
jgi:hypothetical protein